MINLLPDDYKKNIRAARWNVTLINYNLILLGSLLVVFAVFGLLYFALENSRASAVTSKDSNQQLASGFSKDQSIASEFVANLSIAKTILDNEMSYTSLINAITEALPNGVILDSINLQTTSLNQQTTFQLHAKSFAKVTELKNRFSKSPLFSNVKLQNTQANTDYNPNNSDGGIFSDYPLSVTISAKINKVTQP